MYAVQERVRLGGGWLTLKGLDAFETLMVARLRAHTKRRFKGTPTRVVDLDTGLVVWPESLEGQKMRATLDTDGEIC